MNPQPKKPPPRLSDENYTRLRVCLYNIWNEHCPECGRWREYAQMHIAHSCKSRGAGGGDNHIIWKCYECHRKEHT